MKNSTTDLKIVRKYPARFTWGQVEKIHEIGSYTIVEFLQPAHGSNAEGYVASSEVSFHVYVDGDDTNNSCDTIETALLYGMAVKNLGDGSEAGSMARAAAKILGLNIDRPRPS